MVPISAYLARIAYSGSIDPTAENLRALHRAHMLAVPSKISISLLAAELFLTKNRCCERSSNCTGAASVTN